MLEDNGIYYLVKLLFKNVFLDKDWESLFEVKILVKL